MAGVCRLAKGSSPGVGTLPAILIVASRLPPLWKFPSNLNITRNLPVYKVYNRREGETLPVGHSLPNPKRRLHPQTAVNPGCVVGLLLGKPV
jgi:hypothetical protein